jgi:hypothetical protein
MVGSYSSTKCFCINMMVKDDLPTPPARHHKRNHVSVIVEHDTRHAHTRGTLAQDHHLQELGWTARHCHPGFVFHNLQTCSLSPHPSSSSPPMSPAPRSVNRRHHEIGPEGREEFSVSWNGLRASTSFT